MNIELDSDTPSRKHALDLTIMEWFTVLWRAFCAQVLLLICISTVCMCVAMIGFIVSIVLPLLAWWAQ
jgi:hypothetical protein